jgi:hypothetical protein
MANIHEGMVQLNIPIPEDLRDLLDSEIIKRCGYAKRGILGEVVTEALREYLYKRHAHTQITQKKVEASPKILRSNNRSSDKYNFLKQNILEHGNANSYRISKMQIEDFIKNIFGRDRRTVKRYIELLEEDFYICPEEDFYNTYSTPKPKQQSKELVV